MSAATMSPERAACLAVRDKIAARLDTAAQAWRDMPQAGRLTLVMLVLEPRREDPETTARKPWRSFTDAERSALGSAARTLADAFKVAGLLR